MVESAALSNDPLTRSEAARLRRVVTAALEDALRVRRPAPGTILTQPRCTVVGDCGLDGVEGVTVQDRPAPVAAGTFDALVEELVDGPQELIVVASAAPDLAVTRRIPVVVDTRPPVLSVTPPEKAVPSAFTITGAVTDVTPVTVRILFAPSGDVPAKVVDGTWSADLRLPDLPRGGTVKLEVLARDGAGLESRETLQVRVQPSDRKPPVFLALRPEDGTAVNTPKVTLSGRLQDTLPVTLAVSCGGRSQDPPVAADGSWSCEVEFPREGENRIELVAKDAVENAAPQALVLVLDTVPPKLTVATDKDGAVEPTGDRLTLRGTVTDAGSGVAALTAGGSSVTPAQDGTWSTTLPPEPRRLVIVARDRAGNETRQAVTVRAPTPTPTPRIRVPSWATVLAEAPDPRVVTDADGRRRMEATNLPWHVKDRYDIEYLLIPPGTYRRGSLESETLGVAGVDPDWEKYYTSERPQHQVTHSKPFYLGRYEVTQGQWTHVMGSNPSNFSHGDRNRLPVEKVSHTMIAGDDGRGGGNSFLGRTGCRLPTEAEWEYACRAGTTTPFSFGQTISTDQANYDGNYTYGHGQKGRYLERTAAVGSYPANPWGLYDMHGNVWEWCADWYAEDAYASCRDGVTDPTGPSVGSLRVLRGGSWYDTPVHLRSAPRVRSTPSGDGSNWGFRVARAP
jgi:formylglycine-generating enzyme required for sulfatase activity